MIPGVPRKGGGGGGQGEGVQLCAAALEGRFVEGYVWGGDRGVLWGYWGLEEDTCEGLDMVLDVCKWVCVTAFALGDASQECVPSTPTN